MTSSFTRADGRSSDQLRPISLTPGWAKHAEGSCLVEWGDTKVLCTASIDNQVPPWLRGRGSGWLTAEYAMLPRSTGKRKERDGSRGKVDGRGVEIQRLIGRSLRAVLDVEALGERTITIDCDVLQADGGTRCASISGAWVALHQSVSKLRENKILRSNPLKDQVAAVSVGLVDGALLLDLPYVEDVRASLDMNVVMTTNGRLIEVQAGAEGQTFTREQLNDLLQLAQGGIDEILALQNAAIE